MGQLNLSQQKPRAILRHQTIISSTQRGNKRKHDIVEEKGWNFVKDWVTSLCRKPDPIETVDRPKKSPRDTKTGWNVTYCIVGKGMVPTCDPCNGDNEIHYIIIPQLGIGKTTALCEPV